MYIIIIKLTLSERPPFGAPRMEEFQTHVDPHPSVNQLGQAYNHPPTQHETTPTPSLQPAV